MTAARAPRSTALQQARSNPQRHIHIMPYDEPFHVKIHRVVVAADPMALPVEFFRAGQV